VPGDEEDGTRIDVAAARAHDEALERGQAHRRVDRAATVDRAHARAVADVAADDAQVARAAFERRGGSFHDVLVRHAVEAVAAHAGVAPRLRHRVQRGVLGQGGMERRVEHGHLRQGRPAPAREADARQGHRVVLRHPDRGAFDLGLHLVVDAHRSAQARSAMRHPVRHRVERGRGDARFGELAFDPVEHGVVEHAAVKPDLDQRVRRGHVEHTGLQRGAAGIQGKDAHVQWKTIPST